jgi:hypothetical protein
VRMSSAEVGWDERGPPPAVGGRASGIGENDLTDMGGVSGGAGMFVPAVREKSTGVRVRKDLRREWWARLAMMNRRGYRDGSKLA